MAALTRVEELKQKFEENPRRYFAPLANELRKVGDLAQAIAICRAHLPNQPAHVSGHIVLAQALHEAGEIDDARAAFAAAVELDPENLIALRYMGDIARTTGDSAGAREWYQRVLDADPRNYEISRILHELESVPNDVAPAGLAAPAAGNATAESEPAPSFSPDDRWSGHAVTPQHDEPFPEPAPAAEPTSIEEEFDAAFGASDGPDETGSVTPAGERLAGFAEADASVELPSLSAADSSGDYSASHWGSDREDVSDRAEEFPVEPNELDDAWEAETESASALSDYEAAPEQWFDEAARLDADAEASGIAPSGEGRGPTPTAEIEALFDAQEMSLQAAPQDSPEASVPTAAPQDLLEEVDAAFREPPAARSREAWSEEASLMSLPPLDAGDAQAPGHSSWPHEEPEPESAHAGNDYTTEPQAASRPPEPDEETDPAIGRTPSFTDAVPESAAPFVTETLAELYLQQGFTAEALSIYRQLLARNPSDDTLRNRIASLEGGPDVEASPPVPASRPIGNEKAAQSVRTFFGRLARRVPSAPRGPAALPGGGESGKLFDGPVQEGDASAARTLASAFYGDSAAPSENPSSVPEGDRSLDHLFRGSPPPDAGPVTLDEFYAPPGSVTGVRGRGPGAPDDDRAADIRQFTSWLEGLKKK